MRFRERQPFAKRKDKKEKFRQTVLVSSLPAKATLVIALDKEEDCRVIHSSEQEQKSNNSSFAPKWNYPRKQTSRKSQKSTEPR